MGGIVVLISYRSLAGHVDTAKREISALVATVQANEPACGGITMLQDAAEPSRFTLIEHWPSQEVFLGPHMEQAHIQDFIRNAAAFLAGPPEISFCHTVSPN